MNPYTPPARLSRLQIEITTGCNLKCAGCQRTLGLDEGNWTNSHMPLEMFSRILANAPPARVLVLQGIGEPTLHPRLAEMCEAARATGKFEALSFNTNALAREPAYLVGLRGHGLNHVSISVDSLVPATAEAARSGTNAAKLRQAIAELIPGFEGRVTLSIVLSRINLDSLPALLGELARLGGTLVEIQPMVAYGASTEPLALAPNQLERAKLMVAESRTRFPRLTVVVAPAMTPNGTRCRRPFTAAYVTVEGLLTPCCLTEDSNLFGRTSLEAQPFAQAWHSDGVAGWFNGYLDRLPKICEGCCYNPAGTATATAADAFGLTNDGMRLFGEGRLSEAEESFRKVIAGEPQAESLHRLGLVFHSKGDFAAALPFLQAAQALRPSPRLANNLASVLHALGRIEEAVTCLRDTIRNSPDYVPAYRSLVAILTRVGQAPAAAQVRGQLIRQATNSGRMTLVEEELAGLTSLESAPEHLLTANIIRAAGRPDLAAKMLDAMLAGAPEDLGVRLCHAMAQLSVCYDREEEVSEARQRYETSLRALAALAESASPQTLAAASPQVGVAKPFYLSYQGRNDRDLQALYGRTVSRMIAAADPGSVAPTPPPAKGEKLRVGFASSYFRFHSISKLFAGWLRQLDRQGFEVFAYDLSDGAPDAWAQSLLAGCDHVRQGLRGDRAWVQAIAADRLHALIYPELGMEPTAVRLACRRLAPVQCSSWGHPVTSGLPTIDYFLSSDLMEPAEAQAHYTETLVRLPNLSIHYQPMAAGQGGLTRPTLGLRPEAVVYICCQSCFKYLPRHDEVFTRIAKALPEAQFLFIGSRSEPRIAIFRRRLAAAFAAAGLDFARHVVITEPVPPTLFPSLLELGDVYLDSLDWSGGNTSLEAATVGLPLVTLPGELMRGRHTTAILRQMGITNTIAADLDDYVKIAVGLADPKKRQAAVKQVKQRRQKLFADDKPIRALETFLKRAVADTAVMTLADS